MRSFLGIEMFLDGIYQEAKNTRTTEIFFRRSHLRRTGKRLAASSSSREICVARDIMLQY